MTGREDFIERTGHSNLAQYGINFCNSLSNGIPQLENTTRSRYNAGKQTDNISNNKLSETPIINELLKKRPAFYKTLGFISMFRKSPMDSTLSQLNPLDTLTSF